MYVWQPSLTRNVVPSITQLLYCGHDSQEPTRTTCLPARATPALDCARAFLAAAIDECRSRGDSRLDTLHRLSRNARVSLVTMSHAVSELRDSGALTTRRGRGVHVASKKTVSITAPVTVPQWLAIQRSIRADVLNGVYGPGQRLPSIKELKARYGAGYESLRRSLAGLRDDGTLEPYRGGMRVAVLSTASSRTTVVLIAGAAPSGNLMQYTSRTSDNLRALDSDCVNANLQLVIAPFNIATRQLHAPDGQAALRRVFDSALGFVVMSSGLHPEDLPRILSRIAPYRRPVALFDEGGVNDVPAVFANQAPIQRFACAHSAAPGYDMGRALLSLGHRRVAYLCPLHDSEWSRARLEGLSRCFADAGLRAAVVPLVCSSSIVGDQGPRPNTRIDGLLRDLKQVRALETQANLLAQREMIRDDLVPLMTQALSDQTLTAWVCGNDAIALECLDFLTSRGVRVAQRISLSGFDNSLDAFYQKLTSYSFNGEAIVRAMLQHIVRPRRGKAGVVEIAGRVMLRESSGRVR